MKTSLRHTALVLLAAALPGLASAAGMPRSGITMADVEAQSGAPKMKHAAVGQPPITRWDYDGFSVYFEHNRVLHTVQHD